MHFLLRGSPCQAIPGLAECHLLPHSALGVIFTLDFLMIVHIFSILFFVSFRLFLISLKTSIGRIFTSSTLFPILKTLPGPLTPPPLKDLSLKLSPFLSDTLWRALLIVCSWACLASCPPVPRGSSSSYWRCASGSFCPAPPVLPFSP